MSEDGQQSKSVAAEALDVARLLLQFGWKSLQFVSNTTARLLAANKQPQHLAKSGRDEDRELETEAQIHRRERIGTGLVVCFFALALLGGIAFLIAYWFGNNNTQWLGGTLAIFLGGMGITSVLWARWLMTHKQAVEPRHPVASTPVAEKAAAKAFCDGVHDVRRRRLLGWMGFGGAGLFGMMVLSLFRGLGLSPDKSLYSRIWKSGQRLVTADGKALSLSSLEPGSMATVYPEGQTDNVRAQTVLIRVQEQLLDLPADRKSWAPSGYVAYSRVCTHAGCPVGEYEAEQAILLCPCHQSTFDVLRAATPVGGPAARALPQLPLLADSDGTLRAGGEFTAPPGPGFWGIS